MDGVALHLKNEFIDTGTYPFEVLGFFEELQEKVSGKLLGTRSVPVIGANRRLCHAGQREIIMFGDFMVCRGHKMIWIKASQARPKTLISTLQVICGREKAK